MRHTKLVLAAAAVMVALLVALAVPTMARDRNNDRNDNHHNSFNVFRDFDRFGRFDPFDNAFHNGFGDFEQDANSGDIDQSFNVSSEGNNSNQCVGITGNANTGNAQNQIGVIQYGSKADDFEFDDTGANLDVSGTSTTTCDQQVNQAAAAG